jgi:hypothetical protein
MDDQAIDRLRRLGYTPEEARFLYLAAMHSGYFVRRQFGDFICSDGGGTVARFIEKVVGKGHAQAVHYWSNRLIFHINDHGIYARIDEVDNRNRRDKAPVTIQRRLMCLDFVLDHREHSFLASAGEKVAYFSGVRDVPVEKLPVKKYDFHEQHEATLSYFVDKFPIYVSADHAADQGLPESGLPRPVVHFAYVDEGARTIAGFETFLRQYHELFVSLGDFEVVFVAADSARIEKAGRLFHRFYPGDGTTTLGMLNPEHVRMLQFFAMRQKWEQRDYRGFGPDGVVHYREEKLSFSDPKFEDLYRQWLAEGDEALRSRLITPTRLAAHFRTFVLPHDYELFGRLRHAA